MRLPRPSLPPEDRKAWSPGNGITHSAIVQDRDGQAWARISTRAEGPACWRATFSMLGSRCART